MDLYVWGGESLVINMLDCNIQVSKLKLWVHYDVHFQTNILWKGMNLLIPHQLLVK